VLLVAGLGLSVPLKIIALSSLKSYCAIVLG
jgi:hypothetical protein